MADFKKRILSILTFLAVVFSTYSQINTYSPYSRYGVGELSLPGFGNNIGMGTTGIALRSNKQINIINPASYTAQDSMSFIFDFGLNYEYTEYATTNLKTRLNNTNIHHIAIAFPVTKWLSASAGIRPFSSVGYNISDEQLVSDIGLVNYQFEGNGGLNNFYLGASGKLFDKLSIGANMSFLFGYLNNTNRVVFPNLDDASYSQTTVNLIVKGMVLNLGVQYTETFKDKYFVTLGAVYDNESKLNVRQTSLEQNFFPGNTINLNDSTVFSPSFELERIETDGKLVYPRNYGLGIAFGIKDKLTFTGDYSTQQWSKSLILGKSDSLVNSNSYKFGLEYIPEKDAFRGYHKRIHYRLGAYYSNTYLRLFNNQINDYGITFGVGLPFRNTKTMFNLGFVYGKRGTTDNNLIEEDYGIVNVSLTFNDLWFFKRKFD